MSLETGARLGPYEVVGPLGAGGMGEVYRAKDTRLERTVALKILPAHAASDPEFKARFEREAKTISQLNHPNICVLYDIGRLRPEGSTASQGVELDFLVMELLEGETLAARLQKGALPTEDVLRIAGEIADALDKAHRKGIIHRDLKPANVMLTPNGSKLLDFGLAKPGVVSTSTIETQLASSSQLKPPATPGGTQAPPLTAKGTILGTFQYMAPEQIEGDLADARSDIWAFGCVLYEMVTGKRAFEAKSQASLVASILEKQPTPMAELQPMTPPALGRIVRTCLAKNPDDRFQTAHDLALQLEWIEEGGSALGLPAPVIAHRKRRERLLFATVAAVLALVAAAAAWMLKPAPAQEPGIVGRFVDILPDGQSLTRTGRRVVAISPDGKKVAYVAEQQIFLRELNESQASAIPGTSMNPSEPAFSPNSDALVFWSNGTSGSADTTGKLWRIPLTGGTPAPICDDAPNPWGLAWIGSQIYFGTQKAIMAVPDTGGAAKEIAKAVVNTTDGSKTERLGHPQVTADGKFALFAVNISNKSWDTSQIVAQNLATGERHVVVSGGTAPRLVKSGHLLFFRDNTIFAQAFDNATASVHGSAVPMVQKASFAGISGAGQFSVSDDGTLVYVEGTNDDNLTLTWLDRSGKAEAVAGAPRRRYYEPRLSPDGTMIATATRDDSPDIYIWDLKSNVETRVTHDDVRDAYPMWLDNRELLFATADADGQLTLARRRADLTTERTLLPRGPDAVSPTAVTPDGKTVLVMSFPGGTGYIGTASLEKPDAVTLLLGKSYTSANTALSPDGHWIAYEAREGERNEVFVRPFPNVNDARFPISQGGGSWPVWSRNGKELFYLAGGGGGGGERPLMSVSIKTASGTTFERNAPTKVVNFQGFVRASSRGYDVSLDGSRFLVIADAAAPANSATHTSMRYITNWFEELRARVK